MNRENQVEIRRMGRIGFVIFTVGLFVLGFLGAVLQPESDKPFEEWYGNWAMVFMASALVLFFVFFLTRPRKLKEWRGAGLTTAFFISLFTEMFGIPLTLYLLAPLLGVEPRTFGMHESHLWAYLLSRTGWLKLQTGVYLVMVLSTGVIALGFYLLSIGWKDVYRGQGELVTEGIYARLRHPQYLGLILIVVGFLIMWPTLLTLLLAPFLIGRYIFLAKQEDRELEHEFGHAFTSYKQKVPGFIPSLFQQGGRSAISFLLSLFYSLLLFGATPALGNGTRPEALRDVAFEQKLNEQVPVDLRFRDESGRVAELREYFGKGPVILALMYYECPNLCPLLLDGLIRSLKPISLDAGNQFNVMAVSIDPGEGPEIARAKKEESLKRYGRPGAKEGWHFLTGDETAIERLNRAVGFRYTYDPKKDQYAHAAGIVILTAQGKVARYFYGIEYSPRDLRLALVEASERKIGSPVDQLLLFCYEYDPATGKYSLVIMNMLRLAALVTVLILGAFVFIMCHRERRNKLEVPGRAGVRHGERS